MEPQEEEHPPNPGLALAITNQNACRDLAASNAGVAPTNRTYAGIEKHFKKFVDGYEDRISFEIPPPGPPDRYISPNSVCTYFLNAQKARVVASGSMDKVVYALDKLAKREKSDLHPLLDSECAGVIQQVFEHVSAKKEAKLKDDAKDNDPHESNPMNIISQESISRVMDKCLALSKGWANRTVVWALTTVLLIRYDSACRLTLQKIFVCKDLPPHGIETPHDAFDWGEISPPCDGLMLGILVPPSDQIKRNKKGQALQAEACGAYRHKRVERCVRGIIGFSLFDRFDQIGPSISFLARNKVPRGSTHWSEINLFDLKYSAANKAYKKMMDDANVERWMKVTHMR